MKIHEYTIVNETGMNGLIEYSFDVIKLGEDLYFTGYTPDGIQSTSDLGFAARFMPGTTREYIDKYLLPYFDQTGNWSLPLAGLSDAAEILGWDRRRVQTYINRGAFPEPLQRLSSGPVWTRKQIEDFRDSRR